MVRSQPSLSLSWQARIILEKATKVSFKQVDDLASVWCECGELELRHENYDQALRLLRVNTTQGMGEGSVVCGPAWDASNSCSLCFLSAEGDSAACPPG